MRPDFSESTYGHNLTYEFIDRHRPNITAYPVFPSPRKEGQPGGGYDVELKFGYKLLFLQFKLSEYMKLGSAREAKSKGINVPYYRMNLSPKHNYQYNQHKLLLNLEKEKSHPIVSYVTPEFDPFDDFDKAFDKKEICESSRWIKPSKIRKLSCKPNHCVAFKLGGYPYVFSEPRRLKTKCTYEEFEKSLVDSLKNQSQDKPPSDTPEKALEETASYISNMIEISNIMGKRVRSSNFKSMSFLHEKLAELHPLYRIALYSHFFLDSRLFIVNKKMTNKQRKEVE